MAHEQLVFRLIRWRYGMSRTNLLFINLSPNKQLCLCAVIDFCHFIQLLHFIVSSHFFTHSSHDDTSHSIHAVFIPLNPFLLALNSSHIRN